MIGSIGRSFLWRMSPEIRDLGTISSQAKESELVLRELGKWEYHIGKDLLREQCQRILRQATFYHP